MRTALSLALGLTLALGGSTRAAIAQDSRVAQAAAEPWTNEELENLLAPIALYPDPILAQVLIASTYPHQIALAAAYVRLHGTDGLDQQPWEISVKAVAHYAPVLNLMAEGEDWTIALGQAYAEQPADVMAAVQNLRRMANAQGNLATTPQQQVIVEREVIKIVPAEPRVVYVPTYDPAVIYFRPVYIAHAHPAHWAWGIGYPIGVWLTYDVDWYGRRVYYHGWHSGGWVVVSRPWIVINPIYIGPRHTVIVVNRGIGRRHFHPHNLHRHTVVHRRATFDRRGNWDGRRDVARHDRRDDRRDDWRSDRRDDRSEPRRDDRRDSDRGEGRRDNDRSEGRRDNRRVTPLPTRPNTSERRTTVPRNDAAPSGTRRLVTPQPAAPARQQVVKNAPRGSAGDRRTVLVPARQTRPSAEQATPRLSTERSAQRPSAERSAPRPSAERSAPRSTGSRVSASQPSGRVLSRPSQAASSSPSTSRRSSGGATRESRSGGSESRGSDKGQRGRN